MLLQLCPNKINRHMLAKTLIPVVCVHIKNIRHTEVNNAVCKIAGWWKINLVIHFLSPDSSTGSAARRPGVIGHPTGHLPQHAFGTLSVLSTKGRHRWLQFRRGAKQPANFEPIIQFCLIITRIQYRRNNPCDVKQFHRLKLVELKRSRFLRKLK